MRSDGFGLFGPMEELGQQTQRVSRVYRDLALRLPP